MTTDQLTRNKHLVESFIQELFTKGDLTAILTNLEAGDVLERVAGLQKDIRSPGLAFN